MFLQSYVLAVCLFRHDPGKAVLQKLVGTAFVFSKAGHFLTARHVLESAIAEAEKHGWRVGLAIKGDNGKSVDTLMCPLDKFEPAPEPYDVAVGWIDYHPDTPIRLKRQEITFWQRIATMGYPASASVVEGEALWMNMRGLKGYVQRPTLPRDMHIGNHPNGFELSFLLSPGLSGAPIFTVPDEVLIGIGVSSFKSEVLDAEIVEVSDDGKEYRERQLKIEQFGFAHDIQGLLDWKPVLFEGASLLEISAS
ncbi:trypsin-like peptidase domain-containing protein [Mesorhizobium sp.]|uniref:trypsin-like peptidase domain-containing protein n=1 Tax=Mesorhizobium sp. TaxID=1871066 RepID=UPI00257A25D7|nr:trypsin-like peptidase domain-containing protein [Mesorhizobium sp.]